MKKDHWTNQEQRIATEKDLETRWGFGKPGEYFRCYLCGYKFKVGDKWRFVFSKKWNNFFTCEDCDGPDVLERWSKHIDDLKKKYWWLLKRMEQ